MRDAPDVSYLKKFVSDLDVRTSETTEKSWLQLGCQFGSAQLFIPESKQHNIGTLSQLTIHTHTHTPQTHNAVHDGTVQDVNCTRTDAVSKPEFFESV